MRGPAPKVRNELVEFAEQFREKHGERPTVKQTAQALGRDPHSTSCLISHHSLQVYFSMRGQRTADNKLTPVKVQNSAAFNRKWREAQALVRATYPEKYGSSAPKEAP